MNKKGTARLAAVVVVVHLIEDASILSLGRFLPVPVWLMYPLGLGISAIVLTGIVQRMVNRWNS